MPSERKPLYVGQVVGSAKIIYFLESSTGLVRIRDLIASVHRILTVPCWLLERVVELEAELAAEKAKHEHLCGACGEPIEGEWFDGEELKCAHCGVEVYAQSMRDGGWTFPPVFDDDEDCVAGVEDIGAAMDDYGDKRRRAFVKEVDGYAAEFGHASYLGMAVRVRDCLKCIFYDGHDAGFKAALVAMGLDPDAELAITMAALEALRNGGDDDGK